MKSNEEDVFSNDIVRKVAEAEKEYAEAEAQLKEAQEERAKLQTILDNYYLRMQSGATVRVNGGRGGKLRHLVTIN
tara:strand:- start:641 stop:868 length:228 start_codon:yes stop_codon:yes gene_type:complete